MPKNSFIHCYGVFKVWRASWPILTVHVSRNQMHITCDFQPKERILGNLLLIILYSWVRRVVPIFNILIQLTKPSQAHLRNEMFQYLSLQNKCKKTNEIIFKHSCKWSIWYTYPYIFLIQSIIYILYYHGLSAINQTLDSE